MAEENKLSVALTFADIDYVQSFKCLHVTDNGVDKKEITKVDKIEKK